MNSELLKNDPRMDMHRINANAQFVRTGVILLRLAQQGQNFVFALRQVRQRPPRSSYAHLRGTPPDTFPLLPLGEAEARE